MEPLKPGDVPSLFTPCEKCRIKGVCKVYGQCERLRKQGNRETIAEMKSLAKKTARSYGTKDEDGM